MKQNELLQKALETADLIAGGGDLNPEQSEKFITYLHDLSVMAKDARLIPMKSKKREINKIGIGQRATVPASEGIDPGVRKKPTFSKTVLDTVELMTPFEITYDVFEDNIEGDNLENSIIKLFATQIAMDHEELYIMGDTASADPFLALTDGWRKTANAGGHVYDHEGGGIVVDILGQLLDLVPEKYLRDYGDLRYYVSPKFEHAYKKILGQRPTPAGDKFLLTDTPATYAGIPLTRVPMVPSNLAADIGGTPFTDLTFAILTLKKNLIVGVHRQMSLERDKNIFARMRQYAFTSRVDCTYEEADAVCIAENISVGA
ncbi:MAG: phage major capsid protein [Planctomycetota bacterium]|nr:MAG: phage major capsid protein [Planctomycetota bacterium]